MNAPPIPQAFANPPMLPTTPTLADVAQRIDASNLTPTRKRDCLSALRRVSELLHEPLSSLPADPEVLRERLEKASPTFAHLSPKTWANLRSNLLTALQVAGLNQVLRTAKIPLTPEWHVLAQTLPPTGGFGRGSHVSIASAAAIASRHSRWIQRFFSPSQTPCEPALSPATQTRSFGTRRLCGIDWRT